MKHNAEEPVIQLCIAKLSELSGQNVTIERKLQLGGGCISNAVMLVCNIGRFFLKWNSSCAADLFEKEAVGLKEMEQADNPFLIIPKVIWAKEVDELPGLLLLEYLQPSEGKDEQDERLGRGLAILHQKTAPCFGFHHDNYCGATLQNNAWNESWVSFFGEQRIFYLLKLIESSRGISIDEMEIYRKLVDRLPELLAHSVVPSLIHGDLWSGNYMYTSRGPALIDPASYYADREMEFSIMIMFGGFSPRVWSAYHELFPLPDGWHERNKVYQLYHFLNHYYLFGGAYLRQANHIVHQFI